MSTRAFWFLIALVACSVLVAAAMIFTTTTRVAQPRLAVPSTLIEIQGGYVARVFEPRPGVVCVWPSGGDTALACVAVDE